MKIRALTLGISLDPSDFVGVAEVLRNKLIFASTALSKLKESLIGNGYEVQSVRITLNNFDHWIGLNDYTEKLKLLDVVLDEFNIDFCSIGTCTDLSWIPIIPQLLGVSRRFYTSVLFEDNDNFPSPDWDMCNATAESLIEIARNSSKEMKSFNFCAAFNCGPNIPFFPASYHPSGNHPTLTVGLENADLLFISFHGVSHHQTGRLNLANTLAQALSPLDSILSELCLKLELSYGGIDCSICPGLALPVDSVGGGMEQLLEDRTFGQLGTVSVMSVITRALKDLREGGSIKLVGYCGVMLPVMEDIVLAARAAQDPPTYTVKDLIALSTICGVGVDTVPVPGDVRIADLAGAYMDIGTVAFRLKKPLSCRFLPFLGKHSGDLISPEELPNSYLCCTKVFSLAF